MYESESLLLSSENIDLTSISPHVAMGIMSIDSLPECRSATTCV